MNICAFTIVAKNYIGLARILGHSLSKVNPDINFKIFVADEFPHNVKSLPDNVIISRKVLDYSSEEWTDMSFKYDLTEFCTSIKPGAFKYLFAQGYDKVLYFDPDIYIFSSINTILQRLEDYDIVLTPQIAGIHIDYTGEHPEWAMNVNGIFNLGFCGMRKSLITDKIILWWQKRLKTECFADRSVGNFTDQKWMDWMPGLLGNEYLYISHDLGMNMAPWNYFERELFKKNDTLYVRFRTNDNPQHESRLVFIHFAGYDYHKMKQGFIVRKRIENLQEYKDLHLATDIYCKAIANNKDIFDEFITLPYTYSSYDNGIPISTFHRRLYHGYSKKYGLVRNPFSTNKGSFYCMIKKKGMIINDNIDKISKLNLSNMDRKRKMIGMLFCVLYKFMGYKRYVLFVKSLYNYCRPEWHLFLIRK